MNNTNKFKNLLHKLIKEELEGAVEKLKNTLEKESPKNKKKMNEGYLEYEYPEYIDNPEKFKDKEYLRNFIIYNGKPDFAFEFINYLLKNTKIVPFVYIGSKLRCKSSKGKELQFYIGEDLKHTEVSRGGFTTPLKNWSDISEYDKWDNERALKTLQQAFNK